LLIVSLVILSSTAIVAELTAGANAGQITQTSTEDPTPTPTPAPVRIELEKVNAKAIDGATIEGSGNTADFPVVVEVEAADGSFYKTTTTRLDNQGGFEAEFDFSELEGGTEYEVRVYPERNPKNTVTARGELSRSTPTPVRVRVDLQKVNAEATDGATIEGSLTTGDTPVRVEVEAIDGSFSKTTTTRAGGAGEFVAEFDFSGLEAGTEYEITVSPTEFPEAAVTATGELSRSTPTPVRVRVDLQKVNAKAIDGATIEGSSTASDIPLIVRVEAIDRSFSRRAIIRTDSAGEFEAEFDFSELNQKTYYRVRVSPIEGQENSVTVVGEVLPSSTKTDSNTRSPISSTTSPPTETPPAITTSPPTENTDKISTPTTTTSTTTELKDSDGDGVVDSEDYAPRDPDVQRKSDIQSTTETSLPGLTSISVFLAVILTVVLKRW
jgi:hypothetical protein